MNEQAFDDLYKEFVNTGYRGSKADFKVLLQTNPNAFSDGYGAFTSTGYKGSDEDFAKLMGVVNPLKKRPTSRKYGFVFGLSLIHISEPTRPY